MPLAAAVTVQPYASEQVNDPKGNGGWDGRWDDRLDGEHVDFSSQVATCICSLETADVGVGGGCGAAPWDSVHRPLGWEWLGLAGTGG